MPFSNETLRQIAIEWRTEHPDHFAGVVLVWNGEAYGWKNSLRDARHERPGAFAINAEGHVFMAEGGDDQQGAKAWVLVTDQRR